MRKGNNCMKSTKNKLLSSILDSKKFWQSDSRMISDWI